MDSKTPMKVDNFALNARALATGTLGTLAFFGG